MWEVLRTCYGFISEASPFTSGAEGESDSQRTIRVSLGPNGGEAVTAHVR
jgi:hypothetical protein